MRITLALVLAACGRLHFDVQPTDSCPVIAAAAGREHTCAVDQRGAVWCFGVNEFGQSIPGGPTIVSTPTQVPLPLAAVEVGAGRFFSCARLIDGSVSCWGQGANGQRGDNTLVENGPPSTVALGDAAVALSVGAHTACALRQSDRAVMCWGSGEYFNLGRTSMADAPTPVLVAGTADTQVLAAGHRHVCVIDATGTTRCWGRGHYGQLGQTDVMDYASPLAVVGLASTQDVAAAGNSGCVVETGGDVRCWGDNYLGQLGVGDFVSRVGTGATAAIAGNATAIATNNGGSCARLADGGMICWGESPPDLEGIALVPRRSRFSNVTEVIAGFYHRCVIHDGALTCWGANGAGELGRGTRSVVTEPRAVPLAAAPSTYALGAYHICAVANGEVYCWGANSAGQVGNSIYSDTVITPTQVATGLGSVDGITVGSGHSCAWGGGAVACWGNASQGQLGIVPPPSSRQPTPVIVAGVAAVTQVAAGGVHTCAIAGTGASCWGQNLRGQLGNGTTMGSSTPVPVMNLASPTKIVAGSVHNCALAADIVQCWGHNASGQLGDGTLAQRTMPVSVAVPNGPVVDVAAGGANSCAINAARDLYCWGANANGEIGINNRTDQRTPQFVLANVAEVSIGGFGACARQTSGAVYCWGESIASLSLTPLEIPPLVGMTNMQHRATAICGIRDGTLHCYGSTKIALDVETVTLDMTGAPAANPSCE